LALRAHSDQTGGEVRERYRPTRDSAKANAIKALESAKRFIRVLDAKDQQIARTELA
jgi:hypothetical protein